MENTATTLGLILFGVYALKVLINSYIYNRIKGTDHTILFLMPWKDGAIEHAMTCVFIFHWTIKKKYNAGLRQGIRISNFLSKVCGVGVLTLIIYVIAQQIG